MSDAYDTEDTTQTTFDSIERCGCGAGLSPYAINVVNADTGRLLTRFCRRCAADLLAPALSAGGGARPLLKPDLH